LYFFLGISILLDVKRHSSSRTTFLGVHQDDLDTSVKCAELGALSNVSSR
jgi:hypothetical protein